MKREVFIPFAILIFGLGVMTWKEATAQPIVTQSYGLTLERDDFPPTTDAGPLVFSTPVAARSGFAIVVRNGLIQRPCPAGVSVRCDYTVSGNVTATFPAVNAGDLITIFYYR